MWNASAMAKTKSVNCAKGTVNSKSTVAHALSFLIRKLSGYSRISIPGLCRTLRFFPMGVGDTINRKSC